MIVVILNLGALLNYHLITGAGMAVIAAKKGFKWAGEFDKQKQKSDEAK